MNEELLNKLLEYIDARIAEKSEDARNSSDGGLIEMRSRMEIEDELRALVGGDK